MKRKILVLALVALMAVSLVLTLTACGGDQGKSAYGIVHKTYVGKATVVKNGDAVIRATLDEACFPSYVTAASASSITVTVGEGTAAKHYYKTVKWGKVTAEFDATDAVYKVNGVSLVDYFAESEANCQAYFEAVATNEVIVGDNDKSIMTAVKLLKSLNNYWVAGASSNYVRGWAENARQTCQIFVSLKGNVSVDDFTRGEDNFWSAKGSKSGSTWSDMKDYIGILIAAAGK